MSLRNRWRRLKLWVRWHVWPRKRYPTLCMFCGTITDETLNKERREDICVPCRGWPR